MCGKGCLFGMLVFNGKVNVSWIPKRLFGNVQPFRVWWKMQQVWHSKADKIRIQKLQMHFCCISIVNCRHGRLDCSCAAIGVDLTVISMDSSTNQSFRLRHPIRPHQIHVTLNTWYILYFSSPSLVFDRYNIFYDLLLKSMVLV